MIIIADYKFNFDQWTKEIFKQIKQEALLIFKNDTKAYFVLL